MVIIDDYVDGSNIEDTDNFICPPSFKKKKTDTVDNAQLMDKLYDKLGICKKLQINIQINSFDYNQLLN